VSTAAEDLRTVLAAMPSELRLGSEATFDQALDAQRYLAGVGWAAPGWPVEHGGRGLSVGDRIACDIEFVAAGVPLPAGVLGLANVGPALMEFGTLEQRASLPRILDGSEIWCQGFSEPEAGSDLAGLRTRARPDGDDFVINGQKVWTSHGMYATHCMLLARTDADVPKHKGISVLLVPMDTPGLHKPRIRRFEELTTNPESVRRLKEVYRSVDEIDSAMEAGAGQGAGSARNVRRLDERLMLPRALVDNFVRTQAASIFGREYASPFGISAIGYAGNFRRHADLLLARSARAANVPFILSGASTSTIPKS